MKLSALRKLSICLSFCILLTGCGSSDSGTSSTISETVNALEAKQQIALLSKDTTPHKVITLYTIAGPGLETDGFFDWQGERRPHSQATQSRRKKTRFITGILNGEGYIWNDLSGLSL